MDEHVLLLRAKLSYVFERLADVAVTEIIQIYQDIVLNARVPAGIRSRGTQTPQPEPLPQSARSAARAAHSHGANEGSEDWCVLSLKAEPQDASDGPVAIPPTLEGAAVLDVPLKTETEGMEWEVVQLKLETETTSNLKNSLFQGSEECTSHLSPGPRIVSATSLEGNPLQDECAPDNSSLRQLWEKEKVLNSSYTETASERESESISFIATLKEEPLGLHRIEAACNVILTEQNLAYEGEPMLVRICPQSEQDQVEKPGTESAFTSPKSYQSEHTRVVDNPEELSNSSSTEQHRPVSQEELCGPSVSTEDTERNIPTISSSEAIESPLLPTTHRHMVTIHEESNGQHMPAPERKNVDEPTGRKHRDSLRSQPSSSSTSSLLTSPPSLTLTPEQAKDLKPCSVRLVKMRCLICKVCGKIFSQKKYLRRHSRFHMGERPYCCKQCYRSFTLKKNLKRHKRERVHACEYCKKQFCNRKKLLIHIRFHTGEKPHGCNLCENRYRMKKSLKMHKMHKHSGNT